MINGHGGNLREAARRAGCRMEDIRDMSANVNPLNPPSELAAFLQKRLSDIGVLPEVDAAGPARAFAHRYGLPPESVLAGNGTTQLIYLLPFALKLKSVAIVGPTYADYADACRLYGADCRHLLTQSADGFQNDLDGIHRSAADADAVFICNPNNPTGVLTPAKTLHALCRSRPKTLFVIDESYLPFVQGGRGESLMGCGTDNVIVLHSMSKIFKISGLRIGFLISHPALVDRIRPYLPPWSVNSLAQAAMSFLMKNTSVTNAFIRRSQSFLAKERQRLAERLADADNIRMFPSRTPFVLLELFGGLSSDAAVRMLLKDRILVRDCANFVGLSNRFVRLSLKTRELNALAAERLVEISRETAACLPQTDPATAG